MNSMEVLILVLALKCRYPNNVPDGNHETDVMTRPAVPSGVPTGTPPYMYDAAIKTFSGATRAAIVELDSCCTR
jgi:hypothetical protein